MNNQQAADFGELSRAVPNVASDAIQVHYGSLALQFGIGNVPNLFLRFYRHLVHTMSAGEQLRLSDAEAMMLVHVMALRSDEDFVLRLSNLPLAAPEDSRKKYLAKFRRMGLVFTSRIYYTRAEMIAYYGPGQLPDSPRMKAQQWDISPLMFNLSLVAQEYLKGQRVAILKWREGGENGPKPVTELPVDYVQEIILPPDVAARIQYGLEHPDKALYYPVPDEWKSQVSVPSDFRVVRDPVPGENRVVRDPVPGENRVVQEPYQADFAWYETLYHAENARSSMLTPNGVNTSFGSGPTGGPSAASPDPDGQSSETPDGGKERAVNTPAAAGNDGSQRHKPAVRAEGDEVPDDERDAPSGPTQAGKGRDGNEPLPARRERVLRDLREHPDRRTQVYIVAVNVGAVLGLRYAESQLRTQPTREDKAEIGKMCREHGGPARVWETACQIAGHAITGDPLDYLWGRLKADGNSRGAARGFETQDYLADCTPERGDMRPAYIAACPSPGQCDGFYLAANLPPEHPQYNHLIPCACTRARQAAALRAELPPRLRGMTFSAFMADADNRAALDTARRFAADPWRSGLPFLTIIGPNRRGKTHLAAAVVNELLARGEPARFENVPELLDTLRAGYGLRDSESFDRRLEAVKAAPVLVLDDLGAEAGRESPYEVSWAHDKLYQIVDHRLVWEMPTLVTSNLTTVSLPARIGSRLRDPHCGIVKAIVAESAARASDARRSI